MDMLTAHFRDTHMPIRDEFPDTLPQDLLARWQTGVDFLAELGQVSVLMIARQRADRLEIVVVNHGGEPWITRGMLLPADESNAAACAPHIDTPAAVRRAGDRTALARSLGLACGTDYPLRWPDGSPFGRLFVLDASAHDPTSFFHARFVQLAQTLESGLVAADEKSRLRREILAHQQTERVLRATEQLHNDAQRIARLGHWQHDLRSNTLRWSAEMFRIYDIDATRFEASYAAFLARIHPEDRQRLDDEFTGAIAARTPFQSKYRMLMEDGRIKWMTAHATTTYDDNGQPLFSTGTTQDITERQEAVLALQETAALHREAQAMANLGHWRLDLASGALSWSEQLFRIFEIDQDSFDADYAAFLQRVHPDDRGALDAAFSRSVAERSNYSIEHRLLMPDGRIKWLAENAVTRYAEDGTPLFSVGTTQDISARKESEHERDMLARIVRHSRELVNVADLDGRMVFLNDTGCALLGIEAGNVADHHILDVIPPTHHKLATEDVLPALEGAGHWEGELRYRNLKTGELRDFHAVCFAVTDPHLDARSYLVNISVDITERKAEERERAALERQLLHTQKLESLGVMAGGIAHDFNNLLQAILGNLELINAAPEDTASRDALLRVRQATMRATDITRQLLSFSGRDVQPTQVIDLGQLMEETAGLLRTMIDRRISLRIDPPTQALPVDAVAGQLQQVLINLVNNAADASRGGSITLGCGIQAAGHAERAVALLAAPASGAFAYITVRDTGTGMDSQTLARMYDPFFSTKGHGRGLGMASVRGIVQAHGGAIEVESHPGLGTLMRVLLPLVQAPAEPVAAQPAKPVASAVAHKGTILLVDDDESIRIVGEALLKRRGFQVRCAAGGEEAQQLLDTPAHHYDCVILDLTMPVVDGAEVFRFLRERHPALPVLLASGFDYAEAMRRIKTSENTGFISKPWRADDLFNALTFLLKRPV